MKKQVNIRLEENVKQMAIEKAQKNGFVSFVAYIRYLIFKDNS